MAGMAAISAKYMASSRLFMHRQLLFGNSTTPLVLQRQLLISDMIFVAYELNLPLNMEKPLLVNGAWFGLMTVVRYITLSLISRYHCLDPTNRDISGLHCISFHSHFASDVQWDLDNTKISIFLMYMINALLHFHSKMAFCRFIVLPPYDCNYFHSLSMLLAFHDYFIMTGYLCYLLLWWFVKKKM